MLERDPERGGVHLVFRQLEFSRADIFIGEKFDLLESHHLRAHQHVSMGARCRPRNSLLFSNLQYAHLRVANGIGVMIHVHALDVGFALLEIQALHVILLALMDIDCFRVHRRERGRKIHFTDHFGPPSATP